jgi:hypothetical protein
MRWYEIQILSETSSSGATGAGAVASVVGNKSLRGAIGSGFDPQGNFGVYTKKKSRVSKSASIIKREMEV